MSSKDSYFNVVLRTDPVQLQNDVDKFVRIETVGSTQHFGFVYTVDPVTKSYVLVKYAGDAINEVEIVPGCSIKEVIQEEAPNNIDRTVDLHKILMSENKCQTITDADILKKMHQVKSWFEKHLIKLEICPGNPDTLMFKDALSIQPPYQVDNCLSNNEVILSKMQQLLKSMPGDYKPEA